MQKSKRHQLIINLIAASPISKQEELVDALCESGFSVTQASVSRDLDELGITKRNGKYVRETGIDNTRSPFGVITFTSSGPNLIVARCGPGMASALAVQIDSNALIGIVGTIAGDDTIFIAVAESGDSKRLIRSLRAEFYSNDR